MKTVLHLTSTGAQFWRKNSDGWQAHDDSPTGPVWILTDLAEESFAEIQIPRIFGRDRESFIARQLASRFPDSPYRTTLPVRAAGGLMDRLAPPHQTLLGLDSAQRVTAALNDLAVPVAGVWATSMLLADMARHKTLPATLFVVLPESDALRIVFIKNHVPVLSRLIPGVIRAQDQAAEITRTLRHLENIHTVDRKVQQHKVLILGNTDGMATLLAPDHLDLVTPLPCALPPGDDWRLALFDLVLASPPGQLAPLSRRAYYVAARLRQPAYTVAALSLGLGVWAAGENLRDIATSHSSRLQIQSSLQSLATQIDEVDRKMADFSAPPELVRGAAALDQDELLTAPSLPGQMQQIGQLIGQQNSIRLNLFDWHILPPGQAACARSTAASTAGSQAPLVADAPAQRQVEINLEVKLPDELREKARAQSVNQLSAALAKLEGAALIQDPAKELAQAVLSGGGAPTQSDKPLAWCLTLPGTPRPLAGTPPVASSPLHKTSP